MTHISMGIREDLRIPLTMLSISFLNELPFKGSYNGKRFMFEKNKKDVNDETILKVYLWKDIYNFENTKDEEKIIKEFEFSKEGIEKGIDFVEGTNV